MRKHTRLISCMLFYFLGELWTTEDEKQVNAETLIVSAGTVQTKEIQV